MRFEFDTWLTKTNDFHKKYNRNKPLPMKIMFGKILKTTDKCYLVEVYGKPEPTVDCLHCKRPLTNKVSRYYGLGPVCGKHYGIVGITEANLDAKFDEIRAKMKSITWKGLIPKNKVRLEHENFYNISFIYRDQRYNVTTSDMTKVKQIREKSDLIISEEATQG